MSVVGLDNRRKLLAALVLVLSMLACAMQPVNTLPPKRELDRSVFTSAQWERHNLDAVNVLHFEADSPKMRVGQ